MATDKEERKALNKAYYKAHKEQWRKYSRTYEKANREKRNAKSKAYWVAHPGKAKACTKAYYELHKEERRVYSKAYRIANEKKVKASLRDWRKRNLENNRETCRIRRALKCTTQIEVISEKVVYLRDGWICQICHKRVNRKLKYPDRISASLDHIIPLSKGGIHAYNNVQLAHLSCNTKKQDKVLPQGEQMRIF